MAKMRKEALEEYSKQLGLETKEQRTNFQAIIKQEKRTLIHTLDTIVMTILLIVVISAWAQGWYDRTEVTVEQCTQNILSIDGLNLPNPIHITNITDQNQQVDKNKIKQIKRTLQPR